MEDIIAMQKEVSLVMGVYGLIVLAAIWYLKITHYADDTKLTKNRSLIFFLMMAVVGLIGRLVLAYKLPGHSTDMFNFQSWATHSFEVGLDKFYSEDYYADYPPLYIYVLYSIGWLQSVNGLEVTAGTSYLLLRIPSIVSELVLAWIVYRLTEKYQDRGSALILSSLILLNPAIVMNSAVWGQIDSLQVLMMIGIIWLLAERRLVQASVLFMLAFLVKLQAVMIVPLLLFAYVYEIVKGENRWRSIGQVALSIVGMLVVWLVVSMPFGIAGDLNWLIDKSLSSVGLYEYASLNALNIYSLVGLNWVDVASYSFLGLGLSTWGYIFVCIICVWAAYLFWKRPTKWYLFAIGALIIAAVYSVVHGMHERYAYPVPFFLLFAYILSRDRHLLDCCVLSFATVLLAEALSMYCYPDAIPQALLATCSVLTLIVYGYVTYVVSKLAFHEPKIQTVPKEKKQSVPRYDTIIKKRLQQRPGWQKCDRKDVIIILAICLIYSIVAFTNLGTFDIPQTSAILEAETVIEFPKPENVTQFKYYAGYGEGSFDVFWSQDGSTYEPVEMTGPNADGSTISHQMKNLYKWQIYTLDIQAKYIKLVPETADQNLPILEIGFFGPDNQQIIPSSVSMTDEIVTEYTDEQSIIPYEPSYLTDFYFDEIYHVRTAYENIHGIRPYEITHPPLGKIIIAIGIQSFGMNSIGWRIMGALAGVCMLPVMYVLARMLFTERRYAIFATILLAVDGMHYAQTRIGTIDSYSVLWIMTMYLFMYRYSMTNFNIQPLKKTLIPLFWCGLFFGIGAATKWLCLYAGFGLLAIYIYLMVQRYREYKYARKMHHFTDLVRNYKRKLTSTLLWSILFFIVIPGAIYLVSYIPYTLVSDGGAYSFADILGNQSYMLNYHAHLNPDHVHAFASKWYTWPINMRPILYFSNQTENTIDTLSSMGNPFVWWIGIIAVVSLLLWTIRKPHVRTFTLFFLVVASLAEYVPWWFISREVFIYHYFAVVPFMILLIVTWLMDLEKRYKWGRMFGYWIVIICTAGFAIFYPVLTGVPTPKEYVNAIRWFESWPFY